MLRILCAAALALCAFSAAAHARSVKIDIFDGDRYVARMKPVTFARDVTDAVRKHRAKQPKVKRQKTNIRAPRQPPREAPQMMYPPPADRYFDVRERAPASAPYSEPNSSPLASIAGRFLGGNPTGWARAWCGAFMRMVVRSAGLPDNPRGAVARSWEAYGHASGPHVGAIAVMPHHVGIVIGRCQGGGLLVRSGNHNRRVGDGCYAASRFIAFRAPG